MKAFITFRIPGNQWSFFCEHTQQADTKSKYHCSKKNIARRGTEV